MAKLKTEKDAFGVNQLEKSIWEHCAIHPGDGTKLKALKQKILNEEITIQEALDHPLAHILIEMDQG